MLSQPHIGYQYWQAPLRDTLPPVSYVSTKQLSLGNARAIHTRFTAEGSLGAWPGDNRHNCPLGYNCPDPTLAPMDRYGNASRWFEVSAAGTQRVDFTTTSSGWLVVEPTSGRIAADGSSDTRVYISVDWEARARAKDAGQDVRQGTVKVVSSDTAMVLITVPIRDLLPPPKGFKGALPGDGYLVLEAAHHQATTSVDGTSWTEIPYYGRTHSGMAILPLSTKRFEPGAGPSMRFDFWSNVLPVKEDSGERFVDLILHIGPSLNYVLGKPLQLALALDDTPPTVIQPIPDAPLGSLPPDWEEVVANEVREIKVTLDLRGDAPAKHSLSIWAMQVGIVVERVMIDFGGIKGRSQSYLGPPESVIVR